MRDWGWVCSQSGCGSATGLGQVWDGCGGEEGFEVENRTGAGVVAGDRLRMGLRWLRMGLGLETSWFGARAGDGVGNSRGRCSCTRLPHLGLYRNNLLQQFLEAWYKKIPPQAILLEQYQL